MPEQAKKKWAKALQEVKVDPAWNKLVTAVGSIPSVLTPEQTRKFILNQYQEITELVNRLNLKAPSH